MGVAVSMGLHGLILVGAFAASYWLSHHQSKEETVAVKFFTPPPPPPPPPPPSGKKHTKKTPKVTPIKKAELIQPKETPKEQPKEEEEEDDGGVEGGVEGGVKGGVVGGVVGGVIGGQLGGQMSYERVTRPPKQIAGDRQPPIPSTLLTTIRGSKGVILAKIKVNTSGGIDDVEIVRSTIPQLDDIIKKHIRATWKFEPPLNGGRPARVEFLQPFSFSFQ